MTRDISRAMVKPVMGNLDMAKQVTDSRDMGSQGTVSQDTASRGTSSRDMDSPGMGSLSRRMPLRDRTATILTTSSIPTCL